MLLRSTSPEWLIHAAAEELYVDGSVVHGARLLASIRCTSASAKILKHSSQHQGMNQDDVHVVLGEVAFGLALEATMLAQGPLSVEVGLLMNRLGNLRRFTLFSMGPISLLTTI
jgi:hypothetical protein